MLGKQQKLLMELKEKSISLTEIFGGIGWILGIVGVAAVLDEPSKHGKIITYPGRSTMHIEEFALGDSSIHNLDPRVKIVAALAFSMIVALNNSITMSAVAFCFPLALIVFARISIKKLLMRLAAVNVFIGLLWLCLPFTVPGEVTLLTGAAFHFPGRHYCGFFFDPEIERDHSGHNSALRHISRVHPGPRSEPPWGPR